jgi:hypothetical protein
LTPETELSQPDDETASSLLDDDDNLNNVKVPRGHTQKGTTARAQKTTQTLQRYASVRHTSTANITNHQKTILLKIGRATNIHRRMSQWTKQCGQNITLIRYYPYTSSNTKPSALSTSDSMIRGRKVPHVHRVERLIHLELNEKRVVKPVCENCGREHREWFEIKASRDGIQAVDEVVRRWVGWGEGADAT